MITRGGNTAIKKTAKTKGLVDLNLILRILILLIFIFTWYAYNIKGDNEYINKTSIWLGSLMAFELYIFLLVEKKRRDPFIILLCVQCVFYFLLRILTLSLYPFSLAFKRFNFNSHDLNYAIFFIIVANIALFFGFYVNKVKSIKFTDVDKIYPTKQHYVFLIYLFGLLMSFPSTMGLAPIEWFMTFIGSLFVDFYIIILMIIIYLFLFKRRIKYLYKFLLISALIFFVVLHTLVGSRGAMLMVFYFIIFALLSINGFIKVKKGILLSSLFVFPIMIIVFIISTYLRPRLEERSKVNNETIEVLKEFDLKETFKNNSEIILSPIFDRIGYLDYGAELIAHKEIYDPIFTYKYYTMSFIDNIFTPGFDIFNIPKISNSQKFVYNNEGTPMKSKVSEAYQSDEFTLYGEFYIAFGKWFSLIPIFLLAFFLKRVYVKLAGKNIFELCIKRSIVLMIFFYFIQSYGIDWIASISLGFIVTYFTFKSFFKFENSNI